MKAISPVMPNTPQVREVVYGKSNKFYSPVPAVNASAVNGRNVVVMRWSLSFWERIKVLFGGSVWVEEVVMDDGWLHPVVLTAQEPSFGRATNGNA